MISLKDHSEKIAWTSIVIGLLTIVFFTLTGNFIHFQEPLSPPVLAEYGNLISGTAGIFFTLAGYFLIFSTLRASKTQQFETTFNTRFTLFHEFRTKSIALKHKRDETTSEAIYYGIEFFDILFYSQLNLKKNRKESVHYYKTHLGIHRAQFGYYFSLFEMCLSSLNENQISESQKKIFNTFLENMLNEQERFIFSFMEHIVDTNQFPLCYSFSVNFKKYYRDCVLDI